MLDNAINDKKRRTALDKFDIEDTSHKNYLLAKAIHSTEQGTARLLDEIIELVASVEISKSDLSMCDRHVSPDEAAFESDHEQFAEMHCAYL